MFSDKIIEGYSRVCTLWVIFCYFEFIKYLENTGNILSRINESWCKSVTIYSRDTCSFCCSTNLDWNLEELFQDTTSYMMYFNKDVLKLPPPAPPYGSTKKFLYTQSCIKLEFKVNDHPCNLYPVWNEKCRHNNYKYNVMRKALFTAFPDEVEAGSTSQKKQAYSCVKCSQIL